MATTGTPQFTYSQVADSLRATITTGELRPGDRLPSIRELSAKYGIAVGTARSALMVLRDEGVVRAGSTKGYYVADNPPQPAPRPGGLESEMALMRRELSRLTERVDELEGLVRGPRD